MSKEDDHTTNSKQRPAKRNEEMARECNSAHANRSSQTSTMTSTFKAKVSAVPATSGSLQTVTSKAMTKVSEQLFVENKKLKLKVKNLAATVRNLKTKNKQLENFKNKTLNKKLKFTEQVNELQRLVDSTKTKNKDTFSPEILAKLDQLG